MLKNARIQAGEQSRKDAMYAEANEWLKTTLIIYQNNRVLSLLEGLANNFEFGTAFVRINCLIRYCLCFYLMLI